MRDILTVFRFTLRDNIRKKAFIISTVIVLIVIVAGFTILGMNSGKGGSGDSGTTANAQDYGTFGSSATCYIVDDGSLIPGFQEVLKTAFPDTNFVASKSAELEQVKDKIKSDKDVSAIEVKPGESAPALCIYDNSYKSDVPTYGIGEIARVTYVSGVLTNAGVSPDITKQALSSLSCNTVSLGKEDPSGYILGILLTMVIFFAVYFYGYGVAMSVASEKTSRVMETLIVSAKPSRVLIGKCLAMGVLGLIQLTLFLVVGGASFKAFVPPDFTIAGMPLSLSSFTVSSALLVLVYFLLGYALYAMINSVCGASVSRAEDLHAAMMPAALLSMISFYIAYAVMFLPSGSAKRIVTYIPFTAPFIMPFRLLNETVPASEILTSIGLLIAATALVSAISIRLYAGSVLHYGQRLKLGQMFRMK